jgi:hypothetical protein
MNRWPTAFMVAAAFGLLSGPAQAARPLLAELMARAPAAEDAPAMSALALEACMTRAHTLDGEGAAVDAAVGAIDRLAAEDRFLKNQIRAEIAVVEGYDEAGLKAFQQRVIRQSEVTKKFEAELPLYQQKQKAYDAALVEFDRDCAQPFSARDLAAVKAKLGIK